MRPLILIALMLTLAVVGCKKSGRADAAAPLAQEQVAPQQPTQETSASQEPAYQFGTDNPDLNYVKVDVIDQGTVRNDWSHNKIRVLKTTNASGDYAYFYCDTAESTCFGPKLHTVYTLHDTGIANGWYFLYPPGADINALAKHHGTPLYKYCPQCKP